MEAKYKTKTPLEHRHIKTLLLPDINWVKIPAGDFIFGENKTRKKLYSDTFYMSRYPITNIQYQSFTDDGGYENERWWKDIERLEPQASKWKQPNRPKTNVSWYEAIAFTRWLSFRFGYKVHLPKEHQWEKAARNNKEHLYPWGTEYMEGYANVRDESNLSQTTAVGVYPQGYTDAGIADLSGNVVEWCLDKYDKSTKPTQVDTSGDSRVLRGGSWLRYPELARATLRSWYNPDYRGNYIGFRVVCVLPFTER